MKLEITGIDAEQALRLVENDIDLFHVLLRQFLHQFEGAIDKSHRLWREGRHAKAADHLHAIRGALGNLSATAAVREIQTLEQALKQGTAIELSTRFELLEATVEALFTNIRSYLDHTVSSTHQPGDSICEALDPVLINNFIRALESNDASALDMFDSLRQALQQVLSPDDIKNLESAMDGLHFDQVLLTLRADGIA